MTVDSAEKCCEPVSALSMNDQPENGGHKGCAPATHRRVITFTARRQHRKSVSAHHFVQFAGHGSGSSIDGSEKLPRSIQPQAMHTNEQMREMRGPTDRLTGKDGPVTSSWTAPWPSIGQPSRRGSAHKQYRLGVLITQACRRSVLEPE